MKVSICYRQSLRKGAIMDIDVRVENDKVIIECGTPENAIGLIQILHKLLVDMIPGTIELGAIYKERSTGEIQKTGVFKDELQN